MVRFYVVWRGDEDEFFVTGVDFEGTFAQRDKHSATLSATVWVMLAWDVEYGPEFGQNPFAVQNPASFDLITVFTGDNIHFTL